MMALTGILGLFGAGGAAAAGTAAAGTAATAAGAGLSISSILSGVATVGGIVATLASANAEAGQLKAAAHDAEAQRGQEVLASVDRKRSMLASAQEAVGASDAAYAASGVDLSFGSAQQARQDAYRSADLGINTDSATTAGRLSRLSEQAQQLRKSARMTKVLGWVTGGVKGLEAWQGYKQRGV